MKSAKEFMGTGRALALFGGLMIALTGCDDFLAVDNLTAPDREDATASPSDLEAFIAGSFYPSLFNALHNDEDATAAFPLQAAEFSATMQGQDTQLQYGDHVAEPRAVHDNGIVVSLGNGPQGPRDVWAHVHETNSVVHDGLEVLLGSVVITEGSTDVTPRARAFAKLIQGWSLGYLGLVFDEAHVVPEDVPIPQDPDALLELTLETLTPYPEVIAAAVAALEEAIAIAEQNPSVVTYPSFSQSNLWFGTANPVSNTEFIQLANTLAARFLVLSARDPQERAAVDWGRVLAFTANGLTTDLEFELSNQRQSVLLNHFTNDPNGERNYRWDYRAIGPADQSGAYQDWIASPLDQRDRFDIVTPDRRITGPTPTSDGSYTAYRADDNGFSPDRGRYAYSAYQWRRHAFSVGLPSDDDETGDNLGTAVLVSADENNLLRAEALARTNDAAGAAILANITRTRSQTAGGTGYPGLPEATAAGAPADPVSGDCVPRTDSGACGDILAVIRYERMVELAALDMVRGYADSRGWGTLADGTPIHYPVPGNALDQYGLANYTYGGVGQPGGATYAPGT
jgi:hypothetical protein